MILSYLEGRPRAREIVERDDGFVEATDGPANYFASLRGCFLLFDRPPDQLCRAFEGDTSASPFVIEASYLGERRYTDFLERDGLEMTFHSVHRPLETYARALEASGFALETIRKPPTTAHVEREERAARWRPIPCFLYGRARKT